MKLKVSVTTVEKQKSACLIVGVFQNNVLTPTAKRLDKLTNGALLSAIKHSGFKANIGQFLSIFTPAKIQAKQILVIGCGDEAKLTPMAFRKISYCAAKTAADITDNTVTNYLSEISVKDHSPAWKVKQITETSIEASYRFDRYKTKKDKTGSINEMIIDIASATQLKSCERALTEGSAIAEAVSYTKDLANTPSNICTPTYLVNAARELAKKHKSLSIKVLNEAEMKKLGMGSLLGVAKGSSEEAYLIVLEYKGATKTKPNIALVGKGITFDTGGNSLKSAEGMVGMKYDMCGAATVMGTLKAAAELKLPQNIIGLMPVVENMPGGDAYKPEDILKSMSGITIEVISTDAEGRLILADALTYAERYKPQYVIDIATLTGAVVVALGAHATGLISNDEGLTQILLKAGTESNDRAWPLPLWDEYQEQINSPFADIQNTGGRSAGTITAGCFLSRFTQKFKWAHLDVAGTAAMMMGGERYATGRPVPMLMQFLIDQSKKH